ncbi:hypothetical protein Y788_22075 [Pantoea dispersa 625]|nr:hypothetical protein Y788_22075 [Pantoea dispersa 625]
MPTFARIKTSHMTIIIKDMRTLLAKNINDAMMILINIRTKLASIIILNIYPTT